MQNAQCGPLADASAAPRPDEDLVRVKDALRESNEHLLLALAAARLGDWTWDLRTDLVALSARAAEILGVPVAPLRWAELLELLHADDRERTRVAVERALATNSDFAIEFRLSARDDGERWIAARGRCRHGSDGAPRSMAGILRDVTKRRRIEDSLREETQALALLNDTCRSIAAQLDVRQAVQTVTDAATQLCGAQFGAFFYNVPAADGELLQLFALSGAPRESFEWMGLPRNTPVFDPTLRGVATVRSDDITLDGRYGKLEPHRGMPKGHMPVRSYLAVPVVSRSGRVIGGLFFGHASTGVFTERAQRMVEGIAAQAAIAIDNARLYESAQKSAEERDKLLERERAARVELERADRVKDDFLATLSHELRTPLQAILGWAVVLKLARSSPVDLQQGIETIERNARTQAQLIEDLLDMNRIVSGKLRLDVQLVHPSMFVDAAIETVRPAADAKAIRIEKAFDPHVGPLSGDPQRLQQVVWNLLSNAIKFTPRGGTVRVGLRAVEAQVELRVADDGVGIANDLLPHVFERFRQGDGSTTRRHGGLGLGLAIVKHLVELHGGTVSVESAGTGAGATFRALLPLATFTSPFDAQPSTAAAAQQLHARDLSHTKVLVIDDEPDTRELIRRVLVECHADVTTRGSAEEALAWLEHERPDVIVSDIGMPGVDGFGLMKRAQEQWATNGGPVPAIALTAFARAEDRARVLEAGFAAHLAKPIQPADLVEAVARIAARAR